MAGPGPNDYHIPKDGGDIQPGLGEDEPSEAQRAGLRSRGAAHLAKLKEALAEETAALSVKEQELLKKEEGIARREAALEAREKADKAKAKP